jgi:ATP-binding cassette subfamily G (WHITE) protein 2 (PDR)
MACWDNSTRGLDAATALQFVQTLRTTADIFGTTHAVSIYQASESMYDVFDKVMVLYKGLEVYFGPISLAKEYFYAMGWDCPPRQTTGDFLTSVTNHANRMPRPGYESRVPRTAEDFEFYWKASDRYKALQGEINQNRTQVLKNAADIQFKESRRAVQARYMWSKSQYIVSIPMQLQICTKRAYQRLWNDKASTVTVVLGQIIMALIVGSVFYGTPDNTNSFFARGSTLFFSILLNALVAITEINSLYQQRPIVIKQTSYA